MTAFLVNKLTSFKFVHEQSLFCFWSFTWWLTVGSICDCPISLWINTRYSRVWLSKWLEWSRGLSRTQMFWRIKVENLFLGKLVSRLRTIFELVFKITHSMVSICLSFLQEVTTQLVIIFSVVNFISKSQFFQDRLPFRHLNIRKVRYLLDFLFPFSQF